MSLLALFTAIVGGLILLVNMGPGEFPKLPFHNFIQFTFLPRWTVSRREEEDILKTVTGSALLVGIVLIHKDL
jgi:hypothetical protein